MASNPDFNLACDDALFKPLKPLSAYSATSLPYFWVSMYFSMLYKLTYLYSSSLLIEIDQWGFSTIFRYDDMSGYSASIRI